VKTRAILLGCLLGCGSGSAGTGGAGGAGAGGAGAGGASARDAGAAGAADAPRAPDGPPRSEFGGDRPVIIQVPPSYDPRKPTPLVVFLHGYSANAILNRAFLGVDDLVDKFGMLMIAPEGTVDSRGNQFWNATDGCCNFDGSAVDDVAYLSGLVRDVKAAYNVDPKRVYVMGHSNGGFMSYRMACERSADIAAIVSLAGHTFLDDGKCAPTERVSVLQIHGDMDQTIAYGGNAYYPSAPASVERWAHHDACTGTPTSGAPFDFVGSLPGADTTPASYGGCPAGVGVELWTIAGGSHTPVFSPGEFARRVAGFLDAHPKH